jgi:hypothetical protein
LAKEDDSGSINDSTGKPAAIPGESALISRKTEPDRNEVKPEAIARAMARTVDRYSKAVPAGTAIFEGQVVAADGSPLPFARISPAGRKQATMLMQRENSGFFLQILFYLLKYDP